MDIVVLLILILGMLAVGVPIAIALGLSSAIFLLTFADGTLNSIAQTMFSAFDEHYTLQAIPFFILASTFISTGGTAQRIIRFAVSLVGHFRGGLAIASVFACMMFAALSGSSPATVVAIGTIVIAAMHQLGYTKDFAAGVVCSAGTLGILIPPSIVMVVYAAATDVSVGRMFLAGVIPGLMAGVILMLTIWVMAKKKNMPTQEWKGWSEVIESGIDAFWGMMLIVIIIGGIYSGIFTPTEAAAVSAVYAFFVSHFIYRDVGYFKKDENGNGPKYSIVKKIWYSIASMWHEDTRNSLFDAGKLTIMLMFIIAAALILKHVLTEEQIPQMITKMLLDYGFGAIAFLMVVNVILLIGGQFMEPSGLILIVAPLVFPIAIELGIDPIHLGIIMIVNMEIGMITPPVGLNLFVTSGVAKMSVMQVVKASFPFLAVLFGFLMLVTYVPEISTWLPNTLMGPQPITT